MRHANQLSVLLEGQWISVVPLTYRDVALLRWFRILSSRPFFNSLVFLRILESPLWHILWHQPWHGYRREWYSLFLAWQKQSRLYSKSLIVLPALLAIKMGMPDCTSHRPQETITAFILVGFTTTLFYSSLVNLHFRTCWTVSICKLM